MAVEVGAGLEASISDADYSAAGAEIMADPAAALKDLGILFAVQAPGPDIRALMPKGILLVCTMNTFADPTLVPALAAAGIDGVAMEMMPRITRAQSMDVLSSQANLAGYRAVIEAAERVCPRLPDDDDRRRHGAARPRAGDGRRCRRIAGHCHRAPPGRHCFGHRCAPGRQGRNPLPRRDYIGVEDEETAKQTGPYAGQMSDEFRRSRPTLWRRPLRRTT